MTKQLLTTSMTALLKWYALTTQNRFEPTQVKRIALAFLPDLGIGDLMMLSPIIERIALHFNDSKIHLLTKHPAFIQFPQNVAFVKPEEVASQYDLLLSISPHLKHAKYIHSSKFWCGYFFSTQIISNISDTESKSCDVHRAHHIHKGSLILKEKRLFGKRFEVLPERIIYPNLIRDQDYLERLQIQYLSAKKYLTLGIFPQFRQSEWSLTKFAFIVNALFEADLFDNLVLLGGKSQREQSLNQSFQALLSVAPQKVIDLVGKTTLSEAASIISNSRAFLGIDSGLAHMAYALAPMAFVIFTIAHPNYRLPLNLDLRAKIMAFHPYKQGEVPIFDGQHPVSESAIEAIGTRLDEKEIAYEIIEKLSN
ncbi:MAG: glycosyltransferase family 9 protein [Bacteroidota bacterium]